MIEAWTVMNEISSGQILNIFGRPNQWDLLACSIGFVKSGFQVARQFLGLQSAKFVLGIEASWQSLWVDASQFLVIQGFRLMLVCLQ